MDYFFKAPEFFILFALALTLGGAVSHKVSTDKKLTAKQSKRFFEATYFQLYAAVFMFVLAFIALAVSTVFEFA